MKRCLLSIVLFLTARAPAVTLMQTSFAGGEISPYGQTRVDAERYFQSCEILENMICTPQGPAVRRPGTRYVATAPGPGRLLAFRHSAADAYILEFTDQTLRFYRDDGLLLDGASAYEITTPYDANDLAHLRAWQSADRMYLVDGNHPPQQLSRYDHTDWTIEPVPFENGPFLDENTTATTLTPSWRYPRRKLTGTASVSAGQTAVTGSGTAFTTELVVGDEIRLSDVDALIGPSSAEKRTVATITSDTALTVSEGFTDAHTDEYVYRTYITLTASTAVFDANHVGSFWRIGAREPGISQTDTLSSDTSGAELFVGRGASWTVTSTGTFNGTLQIEISADERETWQIVATRSSQNYTDYVGIGEEDQALLRVTMADYVSGSASVTVSVDAHIAYGYVEIAQVDSNTVSLAAVRAGLPTESATTLWAEGAWSAVRGYPSVIGSYAGRLLLAATTHQPLTLWGSQTGRYERFGPGTDDADAWAYTLMVRTRDPIVWITSQRRKGLIVGTGAGIMELQPSQSITPNDPPAVENTVAIACEAVEPVEADNVLLVVQQGGRQLREIVYQYETDSLIAPDLTLFADAAKMIDTVWTVSPWPILWVVRDDGDMSAMTYDRNYQIVGWHTHTFTGEVTSAVSVPAGEQDRLWLLVEREGAYHVEYLADWDYGGDVNDGFFVDSGLSWSGAPHTTFAGLDHLEDCNVAVLADGQPATATVDSNQITLAEAASTVHAGLPFISRLKTVRYDFNSNEGATWPRRKAMPKATVNFLSTRGATVGTDPNWLSEPVWAEPGQIDAGGLYTGDCEVYLATTYQPAVHLWIVQQQPLPLTVRAICAELEIRR